MTNTPSKPPWLPTNLRGPLLALIAATIAVLVAITAWLTASPDPEPPNDTATPTTPTTGTTGTTAPDTTGTVPPETTPTTRPPTTPTTPPTPTTAPPTERPGPHNTGNTTPEDQLRRITPAQAEAMMTPGATIESVYITGGNIDILAPNITIRDFVIDGAGTARYGLQGCGTDRSCRTRGDIPEGLTVEDGVIRRVTSAAWWGEHATFRRVEVHDTRGDAFKPLSDVTIEASWWHDLGRGEGAHADGIQTQGAATDIHVTRNYCDMGVSTLTGGAHSNACFIESADGRVNAELTGNWFSGGNYTIYCDGQQTIEVRGNVFTRDHRYGHRNNCPNWTANTWDTGAPA